MMYASRTRESLTSHAAAALCARCEAEFQEDGTYSETEHRDNHQAPATNEPNPILVEFREVVYGPNAGMVNTYMDEVSWWLGCLSEPESLVPANGYQWTPAQIEHARKVLARLEMFA